MLVDGPGIRIFFVPINDNYNSSSYFLLYAVKNGPFFSTHPLLCLQVTANGEEDATGFLRKSTLKAESRP
jgi:hypothetical protein